MKKGCLFEYMYVHVVHLFEGGSYRPVEFLQFLQLVGSPGFYKAPIDLDWSFFSTCTVYVCSILTVDIQALLLLYSRKANNLCKKQKNMINMHHFIPMFQDYEGQKLAERLFHTIILFFGVGIIYLILANLKFLCGIHLTINE